MTFDTKTYSESVTSCTYVLNIIGHISDPNNTVGHRAAETIDRRQEGDGQILGTTQTRHKLNTTHNTVELLNISVQYYENLGSLFKIERFAITIDKIMLLHQQFNSSTVYHIK